MGSVVVCDQRSLDGLGCGPVVPNGDGHGQQPLGDAGPDACGRAAAVAFQVELGLESVVDRLDPLPDPADGAVAGHFRRRCSRSGTVRPWWCPPRWPRTTAV